MRFRTEVCEGANDEIIIVCQRRSNEIKRLERIIEGALGADAEMVLLLGDAEFFIPQSEILFFETESGKVTAHTRERMYYAKSTLLQLEDTLSQDFIRVSKSCILNAREVSAISHNITGNGEVLFRNTNKKVYVSRGYYKELKTKIYEMRGLN